MQYQKEIESGYATVQTKFNYAWGLVKSPMREHQVEGVRLLQGTLRLLTFHVMRGLTLSLPRYLQTGAHETARMSLLPRTRTLQDGQLRRGEEIQW